MKAKSKPKLFENQIERLLTADEVAELLGFTLATIRRWTHQEKIPYIKFFGRGVRYRSSDLEHWINSKAN